MPEHAIRNGQFVLSAGLRGLPQVYRRFWAQFGPHGQVVVLREFYTFFNVLAIATVLGLALRSVQVIRRNRSNQDQSASMLHAPLIGTFALVWVAFVIYFSGVDIFGNQGRYLYPGIAAWGALVALGLDNWTPRRLRLPVALSSVIVMATVATVSLFGYFLPAYRVRPAPAEIERPLAYRYEDAAELIGIEPAVTYAQPGEVVKINLYWRAIAPTKNSLYAYLHTAESDVVRRDSLPATGNLLSTEWEPGQTWAESYVVRIPLESDPQNRHRLIAGLYDPQLDLSLPAVNEDGNEVLPVVGWIVISGDTKQFEPEYRFDDTIGLGEPQITRLGENLEVCLDWLSLAETTTAYHVFVHVTDGADDVLTQSDFQPKEGRYPTNAWRKGESVSECISLDASNVPAEGWRVDIGLYNFETGQRLRVANGMGQPLGDAVTIVGSEIFFEQ